MAGYRLTLKKLAKKYGVDIEGATYAKVVQEIINENVARASKKMGSLSNRRMKQAFADSIKDGIVDLPAYAISNVTVRKGAENGILIKSAESSEILHEVKTVVLDKTGTITEGKPKVQQIELSNHNDLGIVASLEKYSEHPLANAILVYAKEHNISLHDYLIRNSFLKQPYTADS